MGKRRASCTWLPAPFAEAVLSLHVLMYPKEHPLQHPWIREMRSLSPGLKREIRAFGFLYSDITADFMLPERADAPQSFDEGARRLRVVATGARAV